MTWIRNFFSNLFGRRRRGSGWEPFKEIDTVTVDKPEDFNRMNNS